MAEVGATLIALSIPGIRPLVDECYNITIIRLSRWFPCLFRKRSTDVHPDQWYETPPWQSHPTPVKADFKMHDMEEILGVELAAIEKYESRAQKNKTRLGRSSKVVVMEMDMSDNRI